MNYYIKGDKDRGVEVIKLLRDKGGRNTKRFYGYDEESLYYIADDGTINEAYTAEDCAIVKQLCTALTLPEKGK